jgi:hypothetical protein
MLIHNKFLKWRRTKNRLFFGLFDDRFANPSWRQSKPPFCVSAGPENPFQRIVLLNPAPWPLSRCAPRLN